MSGERGAGKGEVRGKGREADMGGEGIWAVMSQGTLGHRRAGAKRRVWERERARETPRQCMLAAVLSHSYGCADRVCARCQSGLAAAQRSQQEYLDAYGYETDIH